MKVKGTVRFGEINKHSLKFFGVCIELERLYEYQITITSANDSLHGAENSYHYLNQAWDIRTRGMNPNEIKTLADFLKYQLGYGWDVVIEKDHIHVERDTRNYPEQA